jgi:hypothetical protein
MEPLAVMFLLHSSVIYTSLYSQSNNYRVLIEMNPGFYLFSSTLRNRKTIIAK